MPGALVAAFSYDERVLLERHVDGRELAVSLLDGEALPVVEAIPREADQFNYEARYEIGRTAYTCPAELGPGETEAVVAVAEATWAALGCRGFSRVDVMLGGRRPGGARGQRDPRADRHVSLLPMAARRPGSRSSSSSRARSSWRCASRRGG